MMNFEIKECTCCGHGSLQALIGYEKDHLVVCERCSFVFSRLRPTPDELQKVYGGYSRDVPRTGATLRKMGDVAACLKKLSDARTVLDIGCGDGAFLELFKAMGCDVYGTEFDERTEALCRDKGIKMLSGGLIPACDLAKDSSLFDVVVFTEVIEHVNNQTEIVANISRLLKKNGLLYITTPNFSSLERLVIGAAWGMICYPEHISFYSPRSLNLFLRKCGYEKVLMRTENVSIFRIVQRFNSRSPQGGAGGQMDPEEAATVAQRAVQGSWLLRLAKGAVNALLGMTGSGTSLIAVYRKV